MRTFSGLPLLSVLLLGLGLTTLAVLRDRNQAEVIARREFDFACDDVKGNILERLAACAQILRGGAALFDTSDQVSRGQWKTFVDRLGIGESLPGIQGLGYSQLIPRASLARHLEEVRGQGYPDYAVRPTGEREMYSSIIFLEPFSSRNLRAFGYDMYSEPIRRAAMEAARDGNGPSLSGKVVLVQETEATPQAGTLMYLPVYRRGMPLGTVDGRRAAIRGWVYSPYRMTDLMRGTLAGWEEEYRDNHIRLSVYDGIVASGDSLLYDSAGPGEESPALGSAPAKQLTLMVLGRPWTLRFSTPSGASFAADYRGAWILSIAGALITLLLLIIVRSLRRTGENARRIAQDLTAKLREGEEKYRIIFENEIYAICIFDLESLRLVDVNEAYTKLYGYRREELLSGMTIYDITAEPQASSQATDQARREGTTFIPLRWHRKKDGTVFPVEIVGGPYSLQGRRVMFALAHDITGRQRIEEELEHSLLRLESTIEGTSAGTWEWNVQTGETSFNEIWAGMIGYSLEELAPTSIATWERLVHPDDLKASEAALERHFSGELAAYDCECRVRHKDGRWIWVHDRGKVVSRDDAGRAIMMYGTHTDISERKESEAMLKETLARNLTLLRELQHRAKNSFNMITGLVNLTIARTEVPEAQALLGELEGRVRVIS
ncbi:MAG: CHASE domain-containing protein, partial [Spirochaetota bacterium]